MATFLILSYYNIASIVVYLFQWITIRIPRDSSYSYTTFYITPDGNHKLLHHIPYSTSSAGSSSNSTHHVSIKGIQKVPCTYRMAASPHVCGKVSGRLQGWYTGRLQGWYTGRLQGWYTGNIIMTIISSLVSERQESVSNTGENEFESSGDIGYK